MEISMNKIQSIRKDWDLIESLIRDNSRVLDIGCGEGDLIQQLEKNLSAKVHGIEKNQELVEKLKNEAGVLWHHYFILNIQMAK